MQVARAGAKLAARAVVAEHKRTPRWENLAGDLYDVEVATGLATPVDLQREREARKVAIPEPVAEPMAVEPVIEPVAEPIAVEPVADEDFGVRVRL